MTLGYSTVRVNVTALVVDGIDSDDLPDDTPLSGTIILSPMIQQGRTIQYDDGGEIKLKALTEMEVDIGADGDISHRNRSYVKVVAPSAATTNMSELQWKATFKNLKYGTRSTAIDPIYFYAVPDGEINLAQHVSVVPNSTAIQLSRGPRGFGVGEVIDKDGEFVFLLDDAGATEVGRVAIPETPVSDSMVADLVTEGTATKAALDGAYVQGMGADALAPLIYRLMLNEALRLGIVSSSTFAGAGIFEPWINGAGVMCWKAVKEKYGNTSAIIEGRGGSGSTINHILLGGVNPNMISAEGAVKGGNYDAIIINMNHDNDANAGTTADQFYDRMRLAILSVQRAGAIPIVVPPLQFGTYWTTSPKYIAATYKACAVTGAVLIPIEGELNLPDNSGIDPQWYQSDLIHANAAGAAKYGAAFATYFPETPNTAVSPRRGRGTWDDPQLEGKFFHWTDSLGVDRRSAATVIANEMDGRPAATPVLLSPDLLIRNSRFATDLRNPGDQSISDANARETAGFLGNSAGNATYDPLYLPNGGVGSSSGQERCFTIPTSARTDLQFGRDDVAVSVVVGPWAHVNGATQVLMARRTDGGVENLLVRTDSATGNLVVKVGGTENTILAAVHGLHDTKSHLLTVTSKGATGVGQVLVDGVAKATLTVGTTSAHGSTITPLPFVFMARPGPSYVWWAFAQVHWVDIAAAYIGALEDQGRLAKLKTALAARSLPWV